MHEYVTIKTTNFHPNYQGYTHSVLQIIKKMALNKLIIALFYNCKAEL